MCLIQLRQINGFKVLNCCFSLQCLAVFFTDFFLRCEISSNNIHINILKGFYLFQDALYLCSWWQKCIFYRWYKCKDSSVNRTAKRFYHCVCVLLEIKSARHIANTNKKHWFPYLRCIWTSEETTAFVSVIPQGCRKSNPRGSLYIQQQRFRGIFHMFDSQSWVSGGVKHVHFAYIG